MSEQSNLKTYAYVGVLTSVCALLLSFLTVSLSDIHAQNEKVFETKAILSSVLTKKVTDKMSSKQVLEEFKKSKQFVLDAEGNLVKGDKPTAAEVKMKDEAKKDEADRLYPLFAYEKDGKTYYIASIYGNGLWDKIWGYIALEDDLETVAGVAFDHKGETPGLGAEIKDNPSWFGQFNRKKIIDEKRNYVSVMVMKTGPKKGMEDYQIDGISGATITCDGVTEMMVRGLKPYLPYFASLKGEGYLTIYNKKPVKVEVVEPVIDTTTVATDSITTNLVATDSVSIDSLSE